MPAFSDLEAFRDAQKRCTSQYTNEETVGNSDDATFSDAQKKCSPRHSHSHDSSAFSDTAKTSRFSDVAALSDA